LVKTASSAEGGGLYVYNAQSQPVARLWTTSQDGELALFANTGKFSGFFGAAPDHSGRLGLSTSAGSTFSILLGFDAPNSAGYLSFFDPGGTRKLSTVNQDAIFFFDPTGSHVSSALSAKGVFVFDTTGTKQVASFTSTVDGTEGQVMVNGTRVHDYSEVFDLADGSGLQPGSVVSASADGKGIKLSNHSYDASVVGVLSGAGSYRPGMRIGSLEDGSAEFPVAVSGQVYVRVNGEAGSIQVGDLLVSSSVAGVAMRGADETRLTGRVVGKALQPFSGQTESLIRMLIMLR
jgi:hypothetical protein